MKRSILVLFAAMFVVFSCKEETFREDFVLGEEENFKVGTENKSAESSVLFTITDVQDSRCPIDVECIWQGEAEIEIKFDSPFQETIVLSTYDNLVDTVGNYTVKLLDVSPYPISTKTIKPEDYTIKLKVESLEN